MGGTEKKYLHNYSRRVFVVMKIGDKQVKGWTKG